MHPTLWPQSPSKYLSGNAIVCSDNIDVLRDLPDECVDLIYLDPPFNSDTHYVAVFGDKGQVDEQLKDIWKWTTETERTFSRLPYGPLLDTLKGIRLIAGPTSPMAAYCVFMGRRLLEIRRVLKDAGSIYLHCDYHAGHHLRLLLDAIFGQDNFQANITWKRTTAHSDAHRYGANSDTILFYSRGDRWTWNPQFQSYDDGYIKSHYRFKDSTGRRYRTDNLTAGGLTGGGYQYEWNGVTRVWRCPPERMAELESKGRIRYTSKGTAEYIRYLDEMLGVPLQDVWTDIPPINSRAKERIGYPTQKPLALLERVIQASSNEDDLVLDPFCGCGTAVDAAAKLGRKYLGVDISAIAVRVMEQRLTSRGEAIKPVVYGLEWSDWEWEEFERMALRTRDQAEDGVPGHAWAEDRVAGLLNAVPNSKKTGDGGVDARYYGAEYDVIIPIQVKMHKKPIGRPDLDKLLGAQTAMNNRGIHAPMSLMVSLYEPPRNLRTFADQQGRVTLGDTDYPVMQALSVEEMLTKGERPKLPPVDPRALVGNTQTRMAMV